MPIVSVDVINVKYDHFVEYLSHVGEIKEYMASKGAKHNAFLITEAGGADEVVVLSEWESIEARSKAMDEIDAKGMELHKKVAPCILRHQNTLCFRNPAVQHEPKEGHRPHRVRISVYKASGNPLEAANKYIETSKTLKEKTGNSNELHAILHPIAFSGPFNMIAIFEEPNSDESLMKFMSYVNKEEEGKALMKSALETFNPLSSRLLKPITPEKIQQIKEAAAKH